jgi:hypothetical protein
MNAGETTLQESCDRLVHWKRWGKVVQVFGQQTPEEHSFASHR